MNTRAKSEQKVLNEESSTRKKMKLEGKKSNTARQPNMAMQVADDSETEEFDDCEIEDGAKESPIPIDDLNSNSSSRNNSKVNKESREITWKGEPHLENGLKFYSIFVIDGEEYCKEDCVLVEPTDPKTPVLVARIRYMWEDKQGIKCFHPTWFCRGSETVLGEKSDPLELFLLDECEDTHISYIISKANVIRLTIPSNWRSLGGMAPERTELSDDGKTFFFQKRYDVDQGRFEDPFEEISSSLKNYCSACIRTVMQEESEKQIADEVLEDQGQEIHYNVIRWRNVEYRIGNAVYLSPGTFTFKTAAASKTDISKGREVDEDIYPEFYRKFLNNIKGSNEETPEPFNVGYITSIFSNRNTLHNELKIKVNKLYRPENTCKGVLLAEQSDINKLYWSDEVVVVPFSKVVGKCYVVFSGNLDETVTTWSSRGPHRFYFTEAYNDATRRFDVPSSKATCIGNHSKCKGKGSLCKQEKPDEMYEEWPAVGKKLKTLDLFAGCGGLSEGLRQSGIADTLWAVENEEAAAHAFRLNNPNCTVFTEDCNMLLNIVKNGETTTGKKQKLPQKGEVDLLCGSPPYEGFTGRNKFSSRQLSLLENSLLSSYLSYCDYYRPRFFILENESNFVSFKKSMVLKFTLCRLLKMGYQCAFAVLEAGNYGVPLTRQRAIIIAAAPGEKLPNYPKPIHVFGSKARRFTIKVDDKKFSSNAELVESAPFRAITIRDAMGDLPKIRNGLKKDEMPYGGDPLSHYQRVIRGNRYQRILRDHICKDMPAIVEARIANISTTPGSDWRDLPNIVVRLRDGSYTKKLVYAHNDVKNGKSKTNSLRGVCACASGKPCDPGDEQIGTLIPWRLPHTANSNNHWAGLYGRLQWDGFFDTAVTNPEPMGTQGRVLHPEENRVVSVRECARSQGFPDTYRFFGSILEKHRQVGSAVPPPMAAAIGYEIRKCVAL